MAGPVLPEDYATEEVMCWWSGPDPDITEPSGPQATRTWHAVKQLPLSAGMLAAQGLAAETCVRFTPAAQAKEASSSIDA